MTVRTISLEDIPAVAAHVADELIRSKGPNATVLALSGTLGAGKTTFVQALAAHLGVAESVLSPTFVIMKRYDTASTVFTTLVHVDAYRIEDVAELTPLHFNDVLAEPNTLVCIEWPEHVAALVPDTAHTLVLEVIDATTRRVTGVPVVT